VAAYDTGVKAISYVHREMTAWYIKNAQQQQFKDQLMAQMMGGMTGGQAAAAEAITAVDPQTKRRQEIAAAFAKRRTGNL
jgi:hypothetical protein